MLPGLKVSLSACVLFGKCRFDQNYFIDEHHHNEQNEKNKNCHFLLLLNSLHTCPPLYD